MCLYSYDFMLQDVKSKETFFFVVVVKCIDHMNVSRIYVEGKLPPLVYVFPLKVHQVCYVCVCVII